MSEVHELMGQVYAATIVQRGTGEPEMAKLIAALAYPENRAEAEKRVAELESIRLLEKRDFAAAKERDILKNALAAAPPTS